MRLSVSKRVLLFFGFYIFYVYIAKLLYFLLSDHDVIRFVLPNLDVKDVLYTIILGLLVMSAVVTMGLLSRPLLLALSTRWAPFIYNMTLSGVCWVYFLVSVFVYYKFGHVDIRHSKGGISQFGMWFPVQLLFYSLSNAILLIELFRDKWACKRRFFYGLFFVSASLSLYSMSALISAILWLILFIWPSFVVYNVRLNVVNIFLACVLSMISVVGALVIKSGGFDAFLINVEALSLGYFFYLLVERTSVDFISFISALEGIASFDFCSYFSSIYLDRLALLIGGDSEEYVSLSRFNYLNIVNGVPLVLAGAEPGLFATLVYSRYSGLIMVVSLFPVVLFLSAIKKLSFVSILVAYFLLSPILTAGYRSFVIFDPLFVFSLIVVIGTLATYRSSIKRESCVQK